MFQLVLKHHPHFFSSFHMRVVRSNHENWLVGAEPLLGDKTFTLRLGEVKAIEVHHLVPRCHKIMHELRLGIPTAIDFREGA